jgi:hypothetical protein
MYFQCQELYANDSQKATNQTDNDLQEKVIYFDNITIYLDILMQCQSELYKSTLDHVTRRSKSIKLQGDILISMFTLALVISLGTLFSVGKLAQMTEIYCKVLFTKYVNLSWFYSTLHEKIFKKKQQICIKALTSNFKTYKNRLKIKNNNLKKIKKNG